MKNQVEKIVGHDLEAGSASGSTGLTGSISID